MYTVHEGKSTWKMAEKYVWTRFHLKVTDSEYFSSAVQIMQWLSFPPTTHTHTHPELANKNLLFRTTTSLKLIDVQSKRRTVCNDHAAVTMIGSFSSSRWVCEWWNDQEMKKIKENCYFNNCNTIIQCVCVCEKLQACTRNFSSLSLSLITRTMNISGQQRED